MDFVHVAVGLTMLEEVEQLNEKLLKQIQGQKSFLNMYFFYSAEKLTWQETLGWLKWNLRKLENSRTEKWKRHFYIL